MNKHIAQKVQVTVRRYEGGENAVISSGGKSVSVAKSDQGLFDVQADNGKTLYTGRDGDRAAEATQKHLGGN